MGFSASLGCGGDSSVVLSWWLENCLLLLCCDRWEREGTRMRWRVKLEIKRERGGERKKKNTKCTSHSNCAYMHSYFSKCANMHTFRSTDVEHLIEL